jgi:IclR family acetate operon transcriptional repressor
VPKNASAKQSPEPEFSLSVSRALRILSSFRHECPAQGLAEISRSMKLSKGSAARFLRALEMHGYVDRDPQSRLYRPGPEIARVGSLYNGAGWIKQVALPTMQSLVQRFGFTSYLSALRGKCMVILSAVEGIGPIKYSIPVGTKLPVHSTATGQAALAHLDTKAVDAIVTRNGLPPDTPHTITNRVTLAKRLAQVRAQGYSINWEERTLGVASVAAPVINRNGVPLCILSLGFATSQIKRERISKLGVEVRATANRLAAELDAKGISNVD